MITALQFSLNANNYEVYKPKLILETDSCPKLELLFGHGDYPPINQQIELANTKAVLSWNGGELDLQVVGFKDNTNDSLVITCIILPEALQQWFKMANEHDAPLIFQKNELNNPEEGSGFFTRLLNELIFLSETDKAILNECFGQNSFATFVQVAQQDKFSFFCHMIDFIRSKEPNLKGWVAFKSDSTPLRLVSMCRDAPLKLDEQWQPRGQFPTNRYAGHAWAQGHFEVVRKFPLTNPLNLLPELVTIGKQDTDLINNSELDEINQKQLVLLPGQVNFYGQEYFCRAVTYEFPEKPEDDYDIFATLTLTDPHTPAKISPQAIQIVDCSFQAWEAPKHIKLQLEKGFVANSQGEPDKSKFLYAQVLSPTVPREDYQGFYVKYKKGDSMSCLLMPGSLPTVLGSVQSYNKAFEEKADLIIQAEHIAMSGKKVTIEAEDKVSIKGENVVKMGNKVEVGSD